MQIQAPRTVAALAATLALGHAALAQSTWFVDGQAAPGGNGSLAAPFNAVQAAIAAPTTLDGDIVSVAPGEYIENLRLNGKALTVRSLVGPSMTTLRAAASGPVAWLDATGCFLEGFTITGAFGGPAIRVPAAAQANAWIRRCIVTGNAGVGIAQNYDAQIESCTIWGNAGRGIELGLSANLQMTNSIVGGNGAPSNIFTGIGTTVEWCVLDGAFCPQCNNLSVDPELWNPLLSDFRLRPGSPCIDAGHPSLFFDPDGSRGDIGAEPFDPSYAPQPQRYCTSQVNSLGCTPVSGWNGAPSFSGSPFTLECTQVLNQRSGLLFYGFAPQVLAFQGGYLCVRAPTVRTAVTNSGGNLAPANDCSGVHTFDFGARLASGVDPALVPGALVCTQFWFRDPSSPFQSGRSDAISFGLRP